MRRHPAHQQPATHQPRRLRGHLALSAYPAFTRTGSATVQRQEAAAFLANVHHETGGLVHIVEQNSVNYPHYCDYSQPYGCPAAERTCTADRGSGLVTRSGGGRRGSVRGRRRQGPAWPSARRRG